MTLARCGQESEPCFFTETPQPSGSFLETHLLSGGLTGSTPPYDELCRPQKSERLLLRTPRIHPFLPPGVGAGGARSAAARNLLLCAQAPSTPVAAPTRVPRGTARAARRTPECARGCKRLRRRFRGQSVRGGRRARGPQKVGPLRPPAPPARGAAASGSSLRVPRARPAGTSVQEAAFPVQPGAGTCGAPRAPALASTHTTRSWRCFEPQGGRSTPTP